MLEGDKLEDHKKQFFDLIEEMEVIKGYQLNQEIKLWKVTQDIFSGNFKNLCYVIDRFEQDNGVIFFKDNLKFDETCLEILRLFHNYSSSSFTLIEHTIRFRGNLNNENINAFYETELKKLRDIDVVVFMKDLRHLVQHHSLPISTAHINFEKENKLCFKVQKLLIWDGWTRKPREYLSKLNGDLEIKLFCKEYYENTVKFNDAFSKHVYKEYEKDFIELNNFKEYIKKLYPLYSNNIA
ncbi:MAG: hypothetical protein EHM20_04175 [Alphaproteobacteria bacterium]|nr:MAG: hypothetical protein EHM20_04175 [Alphaproteobacteria bacterium]